MSEAMERRLVMSVVPVAAVALLGALLVGSFARSQPLAGDGYLDRPMPQFAQPPIIGNRKGLTKADLDGKVTLINIFASWCASCRTEHPRLMHLTNEKGVFLYGINWRDRPGAGKMFLDRFGNPYKGTGDDSNGTLGTKLGVTGVPETYLIDAHGQIRYRHIGPINNKVWNEVMKPLITQLEVQRRILAHQKAAAADSNNFSPRFGAIVLASVAGLVVIGATSLYALTGRPEIPSAPFASGSATSANSAVDELEKRFAVTNGVTQPDIVLAKRKAEVGDAEQLITNLAARLQQNPDDVQGWRMLGWSYFNTKRYDKATNAYARAVALNGEDSDLHSAYGETLVRAADGLVSAQAIGIFDKTLALNPNDPRARFFKGLALEQSGDSRGAIKAWTAILSDAPANAGWAEGLRQRVQELTSASSSEITGRTTGKPTLKLGSEFMLKSGPATEGVKAAATALGLENN